MVGSQSLVILKESNESMVVKTYNISSYIPIMETKILYNMLDKREYSDEVMRIFATLTISGKRGGDEPIVAGWCAGEEWDAEKAGLFAKNLASKGKLELASKVDNQNGNSTVSGRKNTNVIGESSRIWESGLGLYRAFILLGILVLGF
ncbi:unnamed protein product [Fraxinus pennsylvanica]|uniref:AIR12 DOMON domain-containing protein n=1 Tax=Fraxinus pennsylvanica TaxID=56036 RepID=A0AAD1ZZX1_9LAMI|nr:unnamed protein product [Fraxinus pennsylvanica]